MNIEQMDTNMRALPERCVVPPPPEYADMPGGVVALIQKGVSGYTLIPIEDQAKPVADVALYCDTYNFEEGVFPSHVEAMKAGSMFGWDLPIADPALYKKLDEHIFV